MLSQTRIFANGKEERRRYINLGLITPRSETHGIRLTSPELFARGFTFAARLAGTRGNRYITEDFNA